jgi:hypothetical protein
VPLEELLEDLGDRTVERPAVALPGGVDRHHGSFADAPPEIVDDRLDVGAVEGRLHEVRTTGVVEQRKAELELGLVD